MISFERVSLTRNNHPILCDVSFAVEPGESLCILGPSGSGKSDLLWLLLAEDDPTSGAVMVDHVNLQTLPPSMLQIYRQSVGVLLHDPLLIPDRTVRRNIAFAMEAQGLGDDEIQQRTDELLKMLSLEAKAEKFPISLSRTEKHAVAFARTISTHPKILIADEPLQDLDPEGSRYLLLLLQSVCGNDMSVILMSSDPAIAQESGMPILRLDNGSVVSNDAPPIQSHSRSSGSIPITSTENA